MTGCACNIENEENETISLETMKEDLQNFCSSDNFTVNTVTTDRAQIDEKICKYDVTATLTAPNAELTRMYSLTYNYYEVGGWMMDKCTPINEEQWKAVPTSFNITKEEICDLLLEESNYPKGYNLNAVYGGFLGEFYYWTVGTSRAIYEKQ